MNPQFHKDLSSLRIERENSAINKTIRLAFKLWFVWAFVWLAGVVGVGYVIFHFLSKFW